MNNLLEESTKRLETLTEWTDNNKDSILSDKAFECWKGIAEYYMKNKAGGEEGPGLEYFYETFEQYSRNNIFLIIGPIGSKIKEREKVYRTLLKSMPRNEIDVTFDSEKAKEDYIEWAIRNQQNR